MLRFRPVRRSLLRDVLLMVAAVLVLGTAANLVPSRSLPWWGQGHRPPRSGVDFQPIDPTSADALRTSLRGIVFLDTRSPAEFEGGHVPGALTVAYTDLQRQLTASFMAKLRDADAIIVYGASEETDVEQLLAQELHRRGLAPPYVLDGGFPAWQAAGLQVEGGPK